MPVANVLANMSKLSICSNTFYNGRRKVIIINRPKIIKISTILSIFYISLLYLMYIFMMMYEGKDDELDKISYSIFNLYCIPTTLFFGLAAVFVLARA